jgi:MFS transporter, Spinster family, sphingosine-1-phosphate transporter
MAAALNLNDQVNVAIEHMTETSIEDPRPMISSLSERPSPYAWYVALVLMLSYILSFIDRKLPFILAEPIKRDLHLSDTQIGLITGLSFTLVYSVAAFPIAMLADRYSRKYIIATSIFVWSVVTTLGGFAGNFLQLTAARSGVAIGEAGSSPAAFSILRDYFPPRYRGRAVGLYMVGAQVGILLGLPLAGWLNDLSNWRVAMMLVGVPGILLTLLVVLTVREPKRQVTSAQSTVKIQGLWATLKALARIPTYRHLFWAGILFNCTGGGFLSFSPAYVMRTFHLTTTQTGLSYGIVTGAAGALGAASGGIVGDFLKKFDDRWPLWFVGVGMIVGTPCLIWAFL